jgi:hypothetical protein
MEAIKKFPMLEELELSFCNNVFGKTQYEVVGKACSALKRFRVIYPRFSHTLQMVMNTTRMKKP